MAQMNLSTKQTRRHRDQTCGCQGEEGVDWEFQVGRCKLLHIKRTNNKVVIYSTRNCREYTVMNHNGK